MPSISIVNEEGYKALHSLAAKDPSLFTNPSPERLKERMVAEAGTELVWDRNMELKGALDSLNAETSEGPGPDGAHARTLRAALPGISLSKASDARLWASVNCFALAEYVPVRWQTSNTRNSNPANFVINHWLQFSGDKGRESNAAARLWWLGELAERVSRYSGAGHTADELLDAMSGNVNLYHQVLDRTYLAGNTRLLAAIYDVFLDGNEHLRITKNASEMMKSLNIRAAAMALDMMDYNDLRAVVEGAKPPKGR